MQSRRSGSVAASLAVTYREHMIMIIRTCLIAAGMAFVSAAVLPAANAAQSYESGETLMSLCEKPEDSALYGFCAGYIIGTADLLDEGSFCPPEGHDKLQLVDVTVQWLGNNSESRQDPAHSLVAKALAATFPCN